jgi:hypothetical protein
MFTQEQAHELFDYKDGVLYWKVRPAYNIKKNSRAGSRHHSNYIYISINKSSIAEHRIIFLMHHGYLPEQVDHIDNDRTNNRIENLRKATALSKRTKC